MAITAFSPTSLVHWGDRLPSWTGLARIDPQQRRFHPAVPWLRLSRPAELAVISTNRTPVMECDRMFVIHLE